MEAGFTNSYFPSYLSGTDDEKIGMEFQNSDHEQRYSDSVGQRTRIVIKKKRYIKHHDKQHQGEMTSDSDYEDRVEPITEEEMKKLFTFDYASIFSEIVNDREALQYFDHHMNNENYDKTITANTETTTKKIHVNKAPTFRYSIIPKNVKAALRRTMANQLPFLMTLEYIVMALLSHQGTIIGNELKKKVNALKDQHPLESLDHYKSSQVLLTFDDPYHVFLASGLANFYYLSSRLFTHPHYPHGVLILRLNEYSSLSATLSLYDVIMNDVEELHNTLPKDINTLFETYHTLVPFQHITLKQIKQSNIPLKPAEGYNHKKSSHLQKKKKKFRHKKRKKQ